MVPMRKKAEVDATDGSHIYKTNQGRFQRKEKTEGEAHRQEKGQLCFNILRIASLY